LIYTLFDKGKQEKECLMPPHFIEAMREIFLRFHNAK